MEGDTEDVSSTQEDTSAFSIFRFSITGYLCKRYGITGVKIKTYEILSFLLKSEVLYALYVWYVNGWIVSQPYDNGWSRINVQRILPYLWMLKPFFAFLDDSMDQCLKALSVFWRQKCETLLYPDKASMRLGKRRCFFDDLAVFNQRYNLTLVASEGGIVLLVPLQLYCFYVRDASIKLGCFSIVALALFQIAAASVGEGIFCRYVQCNNELSEVQFISLRQIIIAGYGISTLLCVMCPFATGIGIVYSILALLNILPLFLMANSLCILWVLFADDTGYEEAVDMSRRSETSWSPKVITSFVVLMAMAMDVRYRFAFGAYHVSEYPYLVLVTTLFLGQLIKLTAGYVFIRHVSLHKLINIAKYIFVFLFFLTFAENRIISFNTEFSNIWFMLLAYIITTVLQHTLVAFGLALSVRTAPSKLEATVTCLTDFILDFVSFTYREDWTLRYYALKILKYDVVYDGLTSFFCLYCFFLLFGKANIESLLHRGHTGMGLMDKPRLPQYFPVMEEGLGSTLNPEEHRMDGAAGAMNSREWLHEPDADKSPWGVESDYSDTSD